MVAPDPTLGSGCAGDRVLWVSPPRLDDVDEIGEHLSKLLEQGLVHEPPVEPVGA